MNSEEMKIFQNLLNDREKRVNLIQQLNQTYGKTIVCARVNYPGLYKINDKSIKIIEVIKEVLKNTFNSFIVYDLYEVTYEGPLLIMVIAKDSKAVKKDAINIEESHPIGRLVDIDVYDEDGIGISRDVLGFSKRKCFICKNDAHACVRSRAHNEKDIKEYIHNIIDNF